jgi:hypothetical protein
MRFEFPFLFRKLSEFSAKNFIFFSIKFYNIDLIIINEPQERKDKGI